MSFAVVSGQTELDDGGRGRYRNRSRDFPSYTRSDGGRVRGERGEEGCQEVRPSPSKRRKEKEEPIL